MTLEVILGAIGILALCIIFAAIGLMEAYKPYDEEKKKWLNRA